MTETAIAVLVLFLFLLAIWAVEHDRTTVRKQLLAGAVNLNSALRGQQVKTVDEDEVSTLVRNNSENSHGSTPESSRLNH